MSSRQNKTAPVVERRYVDEPDACKHALMLLLKRSVSREAVAENRPDAGKEINERSGESIIQ